MERNGAKKRRRLARGEDKPGPHGYPAMSRLSLVRDVTFTCDALYAPKEVAIILGVSPGTVLRWIAEGKLKAVKLGDSKNSPVRVHGRTILALFRRVVKIVDERNQKKTPNA